MYAISASAAERVIATLSGAETITYQGLVDALGAVGFARPEGAVPVFVCYAVGHAAPELVREIACAVATEATAARERLHAAMALAATALGLDPAAARALPQVA